MAEVYNHQLLWENRQVPRVYGAFVDIWGTEKLWVPHGIRPNYSKNKVRIAQYISMMPAEEHNEELRSWRINSWKNRVAPSGYAFPGDPRNWEQTRYEAAELSELGKKLLGLERW